MTRSLQESAAPLAAAPRVAAVCGDDPALARLVERLVSVSRRGLSGTYRTEAKQFAHTLRREPAGAALHGLNPRYAAIAVLGLRLLPEAEQRAILAGESAQELCERLCTSGGRAGDLGDAALIAWAAAESGARPLERALETLRGRARARQDDTELTVERAWQVSALVAARRHGDMRGEAEREVERLLQAWNDAAGVFGHWLGWRQRGGLRGHVACFADQVYPIQALARHHHAFGDSGGLAAANRCAARICELQGRDGQWWWHYDARNGRVLEGYPVYSVHQDAMAPMALLDLEEAGGAGFRDAIAQGLRWMQLAPEVGESLIDDEPAVIWRKVGRSDPRKLVRGVRAALSRVHPDLRLRLLDALFPASQIEHESRPYHLGWVLHTWLGALDPA